MENQHLLIEDQEQLIDIQEMLQQTLGSLSAIEKIEISMTVLNFASKGFALYLVFVHFDTVFSQNSLLLFSYLLYALLEVVAFGSAITFIVLAKVVHIILQINTYYMDDFICLPILYTMFKFCLIVTFLVQSITLIIFSKFSHWMFPILLIASLFVILALNLSRMILIIGGKFGFLQKYLDSNWVVETVTPTRIKRGYNIGKSIIDQSIGIYQKINPTYRDYAHKAYNYHQKAVELQENAEWIQEKLIKKKQEDQSLIMKD